MSTGFLTQCYALEVISRHSFVAGAGVLSTLVSVTGGRRTWLSLGVVVEGSRDEGVINLSLASSVNATSAFGSGWFADCTCAYGVGSDSSVLW